MGIVLPYSEITVEHMKRLRPSFLALSPNGMPWCRYKRQKRNGAGKLLEGLENNCRGAGNPCNRDLRRPSGLALAFGGKLVPYEAEKTIVSRTVTTPLNEDVTTSLWSRKTLFSKEWATPSISSRIITMK